MIETGKMNLFRNKCEYCKEKIEKRQEIFRDVKIPGFIGTRKKAFCCNEHAESYKQAIEEHLKKSKSGGSCCH